MRRRDKEGQKTDNKETRRERREVESLVSMRENEEYNYW